MVRKPKPDPDQRCEALLRRVGALAQPSEPPPGLETRLLAFAEGAAARLHRRRMPWLALAATAAGLAALVVLRLESSPAETGSVTASSRREVVASRRPRAEPKRPEIGPASSPLAWALATAPDWRSRQAAALALGRRSLKPLEEQALRERLVEDPNWRVRHAAIEALSLRAGTAVSVALAGATTDPHLEIRLAAVAALQQRLEEGKRVLDPLLRTLARDPDWRVRQEALGLLLSTPEAERAATIALGDRHRILRARARAALASR